MRTDIRGGGLCHVLVCACWMSRSLDINRAI